MYTKRTYCHILCRFNNHYLFLNKYIIRDWYALIRLAIKFKKINFLLAPGHPSPTSGPLGFTSYVSDVTREIYER